jgi:hypothetical protein
VSNQSKKSTGGDSQASILVVYTLFMSKIGGNLLPEACRCASAKSPRYDKPGSGPVTLFNWFVTNCHRASSQFFKLRYVEYPHKRVASSAWSGAWIFPNRVCHTLLNLVVPPSHRVKYPPDFCPWRHMHLVWVFVHQNFFHIALGSWLLTQLSHFTHMFWKSPWTEDIKLQRHSGGILLE